MKILVDSSVWIDFFRSGKNSSILDFLIDENLIATNDLILTELVPTLLLKKQKKIVQLLNKIEKIPLTINWEDLIHTQERCLGKGINGIGIPDLIIAQNALQNNLILFSLDEHFKEISKVTKLKLQDKNVK